MRDVVDGLERRVLVLAPTGRDASLTQAVLGRAGALCHACHDLAHVWQELEAGAAVLLVAEEAMGSGGDRYLARWMREQPTWSDLPILVLARPGADSADVAQSMDLLGNVTVLERPIRVAALVSAVRTALRARDRQYQTRAHLSRIEQSESELRDLFENATVGVHWIGADGVILRANQTELDMLGYTCDEYVGHHLEEFHVDGEQIRDIIARLARGQRIPEYEAKLRHKNGYTRQVLIGSNALWQDGRFVHARSFTRDVTEQKRAEEALKEADRRKDDFLAVLAHELRNPLAPIRNALHILRLTAPKDETAMRVGDMMERQVNHMVRLVDDLMEVSRITRGKIELRKEAVDVATIIRSAVEASQPLIDAAGHRLHQVVPDEAVTLEGDPVRLTQVVSNLLNNAAKYTDHGGDIWLTVRDEVHAVSISVRDSGTGIPREMLPRVFELFTQVDRNAGRAQGGLGIGLTLVKSLVQMHGGSVRAYSAGAGQGSEFVIRLPVAPHLRAQVHAEANGNQANALAPQRVLVVDDNHDAADSLGTLLRLLGSEVEVVYNGPDALAAVTTWQPAVVLLDIGMPGMDGYEVVRRMREEPACRNITVIALTGWGQEADRKRSKSAGFDHHLIKPADLHTLEDLLGTIPRSSRSRPNRRRANPTEPQPDGRTLLS